MQSSNQLTMTSSPSKYEYYGAMTPYAHQLTIIKFMLMNRRAYVFSDMGTGKTAASLWTADMLMHKGHIKTVLIVTTLSTIRSVWVKEIQAVCPYRKYAVVHGSSRDARMAAIKSGASIFITNHDAPRGYEKELASLKPDMIIIDEITAYAKHTSQRSKAMQRLTAKCKSVYGLSGSPVAGGLINAFGIAKVINPAALATPYFTKFRDLIYQQINMYNYEVRPGAVAIVNKTLQPAITFTLEECVDLPPITMVNRNVELPEATEKLFKEIVEHQLAEYKDGLITAQTAGVKNIRLIQILTGFTKTEDGQIIRTNISPKLNELLDIYHESGCKLVVFAQSVETTKIIQEFFRNKKIHCDLIYGDVKDTSREAYIKHFQDKSNQGVLVAQVKTMAHGITLTAAHTMVFFGVIAGNETYRQAIKRIRRIGQEHKQTVIRLISTKFEEKCFAKLDNDEFTSQAVMDMYRGKLSDFV